ncbi:hypothetical protein K1T71_008409 [Dendrolimus kikuchii]|uniref:Uncharacterized protein n=1 Tax=Dendrolimus kikuchii TaxID=765133 RepID=A0ACC1CX62_9NEOP|nr:hypothetical protein K1T71_008409 [Dendrolimus kikuchii]
MNQVNRVVWAYGRSYNLINKGHIVASRETVKKGSAVGFCQLAHSVYAARACPLKFEISNCFDCVCYILDTFLKGNTARQCFGEFGASAVRNSVSKFSSM